MPGFDDNDPGYQGHYNDRGQWVNDAVPGESDLANHPQYRGMSMSGQNPESMRNYMWDQSPTGALDAQNRMKNLGATWGTLATPAMDYSNGDQYANLANQARGSQTDALGMMRQAALGNAPSAAAIQAKQGADAAVASQLGLAAGARGAGAMASAQQQAAGNIGGMQVQAANNAAILRAQEMANARGAYMGGSTGMRGQDFDAQRMQDQRTQYGGTLGLNYKQLALQGQMGYEQMANGIASGQMGSMGDYDRALRGEQEKSADRRQQDKDRDLAFFKSIMGGGSGMIMGGMGK